MSRLRRAVVSTLVVVGLGLAATATALWLQGYRVYVIHTGSMVPTYDPGDIVVDRPAPTTLRPGEVITFLHSDLSTDVVTHRIVNITAAGLIETKGDANSTQDAWEIRPDQVRGRTMFGVRGLGFVLVFLRQPTGVAALGTALVGLLLLWSVCFPPEADAEAFGNGRHRPRSGPRHRRPLTA